MESVLRRLIALREYGKVTKVIFAEYHAKSMALSIAVISAGNTDTLFDKQHMDTLSTGHTLAPTKSSVLEPFVYRQKYCKW